VFHSKPAAREALLGENNKFQIVLTQKVEICCRGAVAKVIGALFQMSFALGKIK